MKFQPDPVVALIGAKGRIGREASLFLSTRWNLRLLDQSPGYVGDLPVLPVNILNFPALERSLSGVTHVIHCATADYSAVQYSSQQTDDAMLSYHQAAVETNVLGSYQVFEASRRQKVGCVIYLSSLTVEMAQAGTGGLPANTRPLNVYACTKLFGENIAELYSRKYHLRTISLRIGQPFPTNTSLDAELINSPEFLVSWRDICRAIEASLKADHVACGVYPVVGRAAHCPTPAREINFEALDYCEKLIP